MKKHIYTEGEKAEITRLYPHCSTKEIARFLGMPVTSVYNIANRLGLKKSPEYLKVLRNEMSRQLADSGTAHRFSKGHVPANKRLDAVSTVNPGVIQKLRDTVLQQIEAVKSSPEHVSQAKQVFQGVNTLINLAKTELEYRKFVNGMESD